MRRWLILLALALLPLAPSGGHAQDAIRLGKLCKAIDRYLGTMRRFDLKNGI